MKILPYLLAALVLVACPHAPALFRRAQPLATPANLKDALARCAIRREEHAEECRAVDVAARKHFMGEGKSHYTPNAIDVSPTTER